MNRTIDNIDPNGIGQPKPRSSYERNAVRVVANAKVGFDHGLMESIRKDVDSRVEADLVDFVTYHANKNAFLEFAMDDAIKAVEMLSDIWSRRALALIGILSEIFASEKSEVRSVRDAISFISFSGHEGKGRTITEHLHMASGGYYGEVIAIMTDCFLQSVPGYMDAVSSWKSRGKMEDSPVLSSKTKENIDYCLMPIRAEMIKKMLAEEKSTNHVRIKSLANGLSASPLIKVSDAYAFLSAIAGEKSWNHFSAKLKG